MDRVVVEGSDNLECKRFGGRGIETVKRAATKTQTTIEERPPKLHKLSIRLTAAINKETRAEVNKKGELSDLITDAVFGVNLLNMEVVDLYRARDHRLKVTVKQTQVSVSEETYEKVSKAAATRGCSMNSIVNSALVAFLRKSANKAAFGRKHADEM
jgi:hypothetical protein